MGNFPSIVAELDVASLALQRAHARAFSNENAGEMITRRILALYESVATLANELERKAVSA